jgi:hypothetical protein
MTVEEGWWSLPVMARHDPGITGRYEADGVVAVRDVLSRAEVDELAHNVERYRRWVLPAVPADWVRREADGTVRGMYYVDQADPYFHAFGQRADLRALVEGVTGCRAEFTGLETFDKPARVGSPALPHQDGVYFEGTPTRLAHVWLPLEVAERANGAMLYWVGTHHNGLVEHAPTEDPYLRAIPDHVVAALPAPCVAELEPGSAVVHCDRIVHASPPNRSPQSRRAVVLAWTLT